LGTSEGAPRRPSLPFNEEASPFSGFDIGVDMLLEDGENQNLDLDAETAAFLR